MTHEYEILNQHTKEAQELSSWMIHQSEAGIAVFPPRRLLVPVEARQMARALLRAARRLEGKR